MAANQAPTPSLSIGNSRFAHRLVIDYGNQESNIITSSHAQRAGLYSSLKGAMRAGTTFYPTGTSAAISLVHAIIMSIYTTLCYEVEPADVFDFVDAPEYHSLVRRIEQARPPNRPIFANLQSWSRQDGHHPLHAALFLELIGQTMTPPRTLRLGVIEPILPGSKNYEIEVFLGPNARDDSPIVWVLGNGEARSSSSVRYSGLANNDPNQNANPPPPPPQSISRYLLNLVPYNGNARGWVSTRDYSEQPTVGQGHAGISTRHDELLVDMGIRPGSSDWGFLTVNQVKDKYGVGQGQRTLLHHRMLSAVRFHFGDDIHDQFKDLWKKNSRDVNWRPARALERLLDFPTVEEQVD